jgi:hypothetical protein
MIRRLSANGEGRLLGVMLQHRSTEYAGIRNTAPPPPPDPPPPGEDPVTGYWSNVRFLAPMDGANGTTVFTDVKSHSISTGGGAVFSDAAGSPFGAGTSGYFPAAGSAYLGVADAADLWLGAGDFTVEAWVNLPTLPSAGQDFPVIGSWVSLGNYSYLLAVRRRLDAQELVFYTSPDGSTVVENAIAWAPTASTWHHIAASRASGFIRLFADGVLLAELDDAGDFYDSSGEYAIGRVGAYSIYYNGYIGPLRITTGVARYTADFTRPTGPFPTS